MIPAAVELSQAPDTKDDARRFVDAIDLSVHGSVGSLRAEWETIERHSAISVYQRYQWIGTYLDSIDHCDRRQPYIVVGRLQGEMVFILPMVIHGGLVKRLKFIGGSHVNFNIGIIAPQYADVLTERCFEQIYRRLQGMLPGVGYIALNCQPETWLGRRNPVITQARQRSGNPG